MVDVDHNAAPLRGIRVLDIADDRLGMTGRFLADLGADVVRGDVSGAGAGSDRALSRLAHHVNKRSVLIDLESERGRIRFRDLVRGADILLESAGPDERTAHGLMDLTEINPRLVHLSMTPFGLTGPLSPWAGTDDVLLAIGGVLSRSGLPGRQPLLPPEYLAVQSAAIQAAWVAMLAYYHRLETGLGDRIDFSLLEAVAHTVDPGFGIGGSARGAYTPTDLPRDRPDARHLYPIFRCADGWARICVLSARQWQGMFKWLGGPEQFADPRYMQLSERYAAAPRLYPLIDKLCVGKTRAEIVDESQAFGVPASGLLHASDVLTIDHFVARGAFVDMEVAPGLRGKLPTGFVELDGRRSGFRHRAPEPGEHNAEVVADWQDDRRELTETLRPRQPFAGLRVLDLGVIVVGAELGRLFADHGADVIKIESQDFPDGIRHADNPLSPNGAWGFRNKRSLGLNLRSTEGRALFLRLVERSDLVLSNFKPGTLQKLGLGYEALAAVNPGIIVTGSSAFGPTGPWSQRMGYGPLVRASVGLSATWRYPDEDSFSDAITVYPDHISARVSAVAAVAKLIERRRTGRGGTVSVSQAETILVQMSEALLRESLYPGSLPALSAERGGDAPRGLFPCAGDDEWCVVDVRGDDQFGKLCGAIGRDEWRTDQRFATAADRLRHADELHDGVRDWTSAKAPRVAAATLQDAGVPAGYMQRPEEFPHDPHLTARRFLVSQIQPQFEGGTLPTHNGEAVFRNLPGPLLGPAPTRAEHTREIVADVLGLDTSEIDRLIAAGVLEEQ